MTKLGTQFIFTWINYFKNHNKHMRQFEVPITNNETSTVIYDTNKFIFTLKINYKL